MQQYFLDNNSNSLTVFFCGWGMDEKPFLPLNLTGDVLFVFDYSDLADYTDKNTDAVFDFLNKKQYSKKTLLAFSYGVYAAGICKAHMYGFDEKIAVNGTLIPVHDEYGVPVKKFLLSEKMDSSTIVKFRERLFHNKEHLDIFNENLPQRTAQSCTDELIGIKKCFQKTPHPQMNFDRVISGVYDKVIPSKNQIKYWESYGVSSIIQKEEGHFLFYSCDSLDELCSIKH